MSRQQTSIQFAESPRDPEVAEIVVKVIGVGGGGGNAVNTMAGSKLRHVSFIAANTDRQALSMSRADAVLPLGVHLTRGLGAGAHPDVGRNAALESREVIAESLRGADMVFVTAGMGGGTGTGAAPIIAQMARELGALTVGVVTRPFAFEGKRRRRTADGGVDELRNCVDTLLVIPNDRLVAMAGSGMSTMDAFKLADQVLLDAVRGIVELIHAKGVVNADFADVRTVMSIPGMALMGLGTGRGAVRAVEAAQKAISSPLLEEVSITGARGVLVCVTSDQNLKLSELSEAVSLIEEEAHDDAEVIFGWVVDDSVGDEVRVTVIATGIEPLAEDRDEPRATLLAPARSPAERALRAESQARAGGRAGLGGPGSPAQVPLPVMPWATLPSDAWDLPPAVRQGREEKKARSGVLERNPQEIFQAQRDDELEYLEQPTFVRKLAD